MGVASLEVLSETPGPVPAPHSRGSTGWDSPAAESQVLPPNAEGTSLEQGWDRVGRVKLPVEDTPGIQDIPECAQSCPLTERAPLGAQMVSKY